MAYGIVSQRGLYNITVDLFVFDYCFCSDIDNCGSAIVFNRENRKYQSFFVDPDTFRFSRTVIFKIQCESMQDDITGIFGNVHLTKCGK